MSPRRHASKRPEFWKLDDVDTELGRVYNICAGCAGCLPLCPSCKVMFDRLDTEPVDDWIWREVG